MEEVHHKIEQLRVNTEQLDNVDIKNSINEIEQIGLLLKSSQEFLLQETQRLKQDLDRNSTKLNHATQLREIDELTLKKFQTKFQDLTQLLAEVKKKEINAWRVVQVNMNASKKLIKYKIDSSSKYFSSMAYLRNSHRFNTHSRITLRRFTKTSQSFSNRKR
jgi:hypothetical protein